MAKNTKGIEADIAAGYWSCGYTIYITYNNMKDYVTLINPETKQAVLFTQYGYISEGELHVCRKHRFENDNTTNGKTRHQKDRACKTCQY